MKKLVLSFSILFLSIGFLSHCKQKSSGLKMIINAPEVLNLTNEEIIKKYGEPDSVFSSSGTKKGLAEVYRYRHNGIEIFFYNGIAKEILINDPKPVKFDYNFPVYVGIKTTVPPDYVFDSTVISWGNLPEYEEVKIFTTTIDPDKDIWEYKIFIVGK